MFQPIPSSATPNLAGGAGDWSRVRLRSCRPCPHHTSTSKDGSRWYLRTVVVGPSVVKRNHTSQRASCDDAAARLVFAFPFASFVSSSPRAIKLCDCLTPFLPVRPISATKKSSYSPFSTRGQEFANFSYPSPFRIPSSRRMHRL